MNTSRNVLERILLIAVTYIVIDNTFFYGVYKINGINLVTIIYWSILLFLYHEKFKKLKFVTQCLFGISYFTLWILFIAMSMGYYWYNPIILLLAACLIFIMLISSIILRNRSFKISYIDKIALRKRVKKLQEVSK